MAGSENQSETHVATLTGVPDDAEVRSRLERLSKAGKLAGYASGDDGHVATFAAFGNPFDGRVDVARTGDGLRFDLRMSRRMPMIFAAALVLSVWPGLPLTDAFLQGFGWYERLTSGWLQTWMWYVPLAAIPAPFALLAAIRKSRASAFEHAKETVERLRPKLID